MKLLLLDSDPSLSKSLRQHLLGHSLDVFHDASKALHSLEISHDYDILIVDFRMQSTAGVNLLAFAKEHLKDYRAILLTQIGSKELVKDATSSGMAHAVMAKSESEVIARVRRFIVELQEGRASRGAAIAAAGEFIKQARNSPPDHVLVYCSEKMRRIHAQAMKCAENDFAIRISGENGVGKEIIANIIHSHSARRDRPMVRLNCGAFHDSLLDSELFGHQRGAFTGAGADRKGAFELADKGTLFLDELGDLSLPHQVKLLRAIEKQQITPLGGSVPIKVDVRIISATNKSLSRLIKDGLFREDLYYRLNVVNIHVPALRERREDIPILAQFFLSMLCLSYGVASRSFSQDAIDHLSAKPLRGNARELKNIVSRVFTSCDTKLITARDVVSAPTGESNYSDSGSGEYPRAEVEGLSYRDRKKHEEREYLEKQLVLNGYSVTKTAEKLGLAASNLSRKLKKLGISVKKDRFVQDGRQWEK